MPSGRCVTFGIIADLHVDIIHDPQVRLEAFLAECRKAGVDFIVQLGDFCYPDEGRKCVCPPEKQPVNIQNALKIPTYADKDRILSLYRNFGKPAYHTLGNHDCDMCSKAQVLAYYGSDCRPFYSFDSGGFHFVVLDACYFRENGQYISYENGNYFPSTDLPYLPPEQLDFLREDLAKAAGPAILFSHQCLKEGRRSIRNADQLREILRTAPRGVILAVNGHEHVDHAEKVDSTWFLNLNSASTHWLGTQYAAPRMSPEMEEKFPNLRYNSLYKDGLFAIITIDEHEITVTGRESTYNGPSPEEQKVDMSSLRAPISARISNRKLPL